MRSPKNVRIVALSGKIGTSFGGWSVRSPKNVRIVALSGKIGTSFGGNESGAVSGGGACVEGAGPGDRAGETLVEVDGLDVGEQLAQARVVGL